MHSDDANVGNMAPSPGLGQHAMSELTELLLNSPVRFVQGPMSGQIATVQEVEPNQLYPGSIWVRVRLLSDRTEYLADPYEITLLTSKKQ